MERSKSHLTVCSFNVHLQCKFIHDMLKSRYFLKCTYRYIQFHKLIFVKFMIAVQKNQLCHLVFQYVQLVVKMSNLSILLFLCRFPCFQLLHKNCSHRSANLRSRKYWHVSVLCHTEGKGDNFDPTSHCILLYNRFFPHVSNFRYFCDDFRIAENISA